MATKTFTREYLTEELGLPGCCDGGKIISDKITGKRRWVDEHDIIFRLNDQPEDEAYWASYEIGSTESQDARPWEDEKEVVCSIVHRTTKIIEVWE